MCLGIPGQLVEVDLDRHQAVAEVDGARREINISLVLGEPGGVDVGDFVLIHVGRAVSKIDEEDAARTMSLLKEINSLYGDVYGDGPETGGQEVEEPAYSEGSATG